MTDGDDPTERLDPTTPLPTPEPPPAEPPDPDRVDQAEVLRFMARRLLVWGVPLLLLGILLVALGLPSWIIIVVLAASLVIVVFEIEI